MTQGVIAGIVLIILFIWALRCLGHQGDQVWLPRELRRAQHVYAEQLFKAPAPVALAAQVDR